MSNPRKWLEDLANELGAETLGIQDSNDLYASGKAMGAWMKAQDVSAKIFAWLRKQDKQIVYVIHHDDPSVTLSSIQAQLEKIEDRLFGHGDNFKVCLLCQEYTNDYTMMEYGSRYDSFAICHKCLDAMIDEKQSRKCVDCGCVPNEYVTCNKGIVCQTCERKQE